MEPADRPVATAVLTAAARYGPAVVARIVALCEADPEREACGFVLARGEEHEVVGVPNAADRHHAASPQLHPRTSRDGYVMDAHVLLEIHRTIDATGARMVAVWHSHVDGEAVFSDQDRADALADSVPVLPGVEYIVVGLRRGHAAEVRAYRFDGSDYVPAI